MLSSSLCFTLCPMKTGAISWEMDPLAEKLLQHIFFFPFLETVEKLSQKSRPNVFRCDIQIGPRRI